MSTSFIGLPNQLDMQMLSRQQGGPATYMGNYPPSNYLAASFSVPFPPPPSTGIPQGFLQSYGSYVPIPAATMIPPGLNGMPSSPTTSFSCFPKQFVGNGNVPILPPPMGGNTQGYNYYSNGSNQSQAQPQTQTQNQNQGLALLPPPGMFYSGQMAQQQQQQLPGVSAVQPQVQVDSGVNGGVSHVLDYDIEVMAEYVVKTAYIAFGVDLNTTSNTATELTTGYDLFLKGLVSVLNATRLPSTTIFQALDFLFKYLGKLPNGPESIGGTAVNVIYQNTMVSFVLANKFNDDKTFTNKSWSQATGMDLHVINEYEVAWLDTLEWRLFEDKFVYYTDFVQSFEKFVADKIEMSLSAQSMLSNVSPAKAPLPPPPFSTPGIAPSPCFSTTPVSSFGGYQTPIVSAAGLNSSTAATSASVSASASASVGYNNNNNNIGSAANLLFSSPCKYPADDQAHQSEYYNNNYQYSTMKGGNIDLLMSSSLSPSLPTGNLEEQFPPSSSYDYYDSALTNTTGQLQQLQQHQQQQQPPPQRVSAQNLWNSSKGRSNSKGNLINATFNQNNSGAYSCADPSFGGNKDYTYFSAYPRIY